MHDVEQGEKVEIRSESYLSCTMNSLNEGA
jgi:hypothetical protein